MHIGVPKEIKNHEYRVGMTPASVRELVMRGHTITVEHHAGMGIGFSDEDYSLAGAHIAFQPSEVFAVADMIVKVKELQKSEYPLLKEGQILFCYLHLAPDPEQAEGLLASGCVAIAYETVTDAQGGLPLLAPMSEVAGRLSVQAGAHCLEKAQGGRGILLGGVPGVQPAKVVVLGGGVVGTQAVQIALGMGADVFVLDKSLKRLRELNTQFGNHLSTCYATVDAIEEHLIDADLVIGAVLIPGATAPKLVSRALLRKMRPGSVVVDVAIDQGGCFETSRATSYSQPTYIEEGIVHYCVPNMPAGVPYTSTFALNNATLPFIVALADLGYRQACYQNPYLLNGLNIYAGHVTHRAVATALHKPYMTAAVALETLH
jgi:alanine dehydrogenase